MFPYIIHAAMGLKVHRINKNVHRDLYYTQNTTIYRPLFSFVEEGHTIL